MSGLPYLLEPSPAGRALDATAEVRGLVDQALRTMGTAGAGAVKAGALAADSVTTGSIVAGSITTSLLAAGAVTATQIAAHTITAAQIAAATLTATEIAAGTITGDRLVAGTITATQIQAGTITAAKIATGTITANEIAALTITAAKIATGTITATQIAASTITATELATDSVTSAKILTGTIVAGDIASGTITATQIAAGTITSSLMAADSVTSTAIVSGAVTSTKISVSQLSAIAADLGTITAGTVTGATVRTASSGKRVVIDAGGITGYGGTGSTVVFAFDTTTGNLTLTGVVTASAGSVLPATAIDASGGGIVSAQITDGTIVGNDIAANTIAAAKIIAGTITATELATDSVTSAKILAGAITSGKIGAGEVTAGKIAAGSITADRMNVTQLSAIVADLGTITAGTVTGALLRTASSGARVEVVGASNAIKTYDSGGTQVQQIDGTGGVQFLAPTVVGGANKQSVRWTATIGGTEAAKLWAYSAAGGQSQIDAMATTLALSTEALASLSVYNFAGHRSYLEVNAISNNNGGRVRAIVRNVADNADLITTIIDSSGDLTTNRDLRGGRWMTLGGTSTLSAWDSATYHGGVIEYKSASGASQSAIVFRKDSSFVTISANNYFDGTNNKSVVTASTTGVQFNVGYNGLEMYSAAAVTGGSTQTMVSKFRVDNTGNVTIAGSALTAGLANTGQFVRKANDGFYALNLDGNPNWYYANEHRFTNYNYGSTYAPLYGSAFNVVSDLEKKTNVALIDPAAALAKVRALAPVRFDWLDDRGPDPRAAPRGPQIGLIAQDVYATIPEAVSDMHTAGAPASIDAMAITAHLVGATREIDRRNNRLELVVAALERTIRDIAAAIGTTIGGRPGDDLAAKIVERLNFELALAAV